jgi:hypothetical protein
MKSVQTPFFATREDILGVLRDLEGSRRVKYVEMLYGASDETRTFESAVAIDGFGIARDGDQVKEPNYLVVPSHVTVIARRFQLRDGTPRFSIDQKENPQSITVAPGGVFRDEAIIAGSVGTIWTTGESRELYDDVAKRLRKAFKKIRSYYVGPEAAKRFRAGLRLTASIRAPREYDLKDVA